MKLLLDLQFISFFDLSIRGSIRCFDGIAFPIFRFVAALSSCECCIMSASASESKPVSEQWS